MEHEERKREPVVDTRSVSSRRPESSFAGCIGSLAVFFSILLAIFTFPLSLFFCFEVVFDFQRAVIFHLGRLRSGEARGPGLFFVLPCIDEIRKVDMRTLTCEVSPQELLTRDSVTVLVDAVVFHRVRCPLKAVIKVANFGLSTRLLAASTLRNILGTKNLRELLTERDAIAREIGRTLDHATHAWGMVVERVEIKDVSLPVQLQRAMATEAEKSREASAKIIAADGEKEAAKALKEASDVISQSKAALELRYLQTLNVISQENSSIVVIPLPVEIMRGFLGNGRPEKK